MRTISPLNPVGFFRNIFAPTPADDFNCFSLVSTQLYLKCLQICYKKRLKIFSWIYQKEIERLQ